uniref:Uncharacterized protein n=1 Tax=Vespula pensylvanica TaxID=30213 RepID=A0A834N810_VESPE|nr:hypothetical protein H0235_016292 [Vespula pensylvanica]
MLFNSRVTDFFLLHNNAPAYTAVVQNSNSPTAKKFMKLMLKEEELPRTALEGFSKICKNPKLAIYTFDEMKKCIDDKIPCDVVCIETGCMNNVAIILSKHNPFTDIINFQLRKFVYNGIMNRLKNTIFTEKSDDIVKHQPVPLTNICKNPKLAFYTFDEMKNSVDNKLPCKVIHIDTGHITCFAIILSKHNPFTNVINFQLQKFVNNGMMNRLKYRIFTKKSGDLVKHQPVHLTDRKFPRLTDFTKDTNRLYKSRQPDMIMIKLPSL